ncbi:MAG: tetratricopeptide repeat protein, partial [Candidatus Lokiarchaeota archaeon]|nr:tetratricopeptide repeat protein [Candidatus Lokiarchaeota archaeon]
LIIAATLNDLGGVMAIGGRTEDAKYMHDCALKMREKLLEDEPDNVSYQADVAATLNDLGNLLEDMGKIKDAKQMYERAFKVRENLLKRDGFS